MLDSLSLQQEVRKSGNSIQITIPTNTPDDKICKDGTTKRISAKDWVIKFKTKVTSSTSREVKNPLSIP